MKRLVLLVGLVVIATLVTATLASRRRARPEQGDAAYAKIEERQTDEVDTAVEAAVADYIKGMEAGILEIPFADGTEARRKFDKRISEESRSFRIRERARTPVIQEPIDEEYAAMRERARERGRKQRLERMPPIDPEVERWVKTFFNPPTPRRRAPKPTAEDLSPEQLQHYSQRLLEEANAIYRRETALVNAERARLQAPVEASGGLKVDDLSEFQRLSDATRQRSHGRTEFAALTRDETKRWKELYWRATIKQREHVFSSWLGSRCDVGANDTENPVMVAIADAFQEQDPHAAVPQRKAHRTWCRIVPVELEAHDDGTHTVTVHTFWSPPVSVRYPSLYPVRDVERWHWDGKRLERRECQENFVPEGQSQWGYIRPPSENPPRPTKAGLGFHPSRK